MSNESETLSQAALEMRASALHPDVLHRGEAAILARFERRSPLRPLLLSAAGLAAALAGLAVLAAPAKVSAAEILRIAQNGDVGLRHVRYYGVRPDGSLDLAFEMYAQNGRRRWQFPHDDVFVHDGHVAARKWSDGAVTLEHHPLQPMPEEGQARDLLVANATGEAVHLDVHRGAVDRYTIDRDVTAAGGATKHIRITLDADPRTQRPLSMRTRITGSPAHLMTWEYPAPDPTLFRLPIKPSTRVYDLDAQRASVFAALRSPGQKVTVEGKTVELLQLWVDEKGHAVAIARADYAYPANYGIQIDDQRPWAAPDDGPFSGRYWVYQPTKTDGGWVQLFRDFREPHAKPLPYADRVTLRLPVFNGKHPAGYATFKDVPVHRTHEVGTFLVNERGVPIWETMNGFEAAPTQAAKE